MTTCEDGWEPWDGNEIVCAGCVGGTWAIDLPPLDDDTLEYVADKVASMMEYVKKGGRRMQFSGWRSRWDLNYESHAAEYAWARYRGYAWGDLYDPVTYRKLPDLPDGSEVRWSPRDNAHLSINPPGSGFAKDDPNGRFNLVTGNIPNFTWRGWMWARDAQQRQFWRTRYKGQKLLKPAYWVPQSHLHAYPYHRY